jgi:glycosyltransferase involved in cell wall biosynthesis
MKDDSKCSQQNKLTATVVISCYNQESYIRECLLSIINQLVDFSFDIIVSDDLSTDFTIQEINKLINEYPGKINLNINSVNLGAAKNYLKVHGMAKGDIVYHFDGDDIMLPGKLQKQYDIFVNDENVNLVLHKARYFNDERTLSSCTGFIGDENQSKIYFDNRDLARWGTIAVHASYAYRRSSRKTNDIPREFMEWFFAMDSLVPEGKGVYLNDILVEYRCNSNGVAYSRSRKGRIKAYKIYINDLFHYFKDNKLKKELYSNALVSFLGMLRYNYYFNFKLFNFILFGIRYFSLKKIISTLKVRKIVAPKKRS